MRRLRQRATYSAAVMTAIAALALGGCTIPTDGGNGENQAEEQVTPATVSYSFDEDAADVEPTGAEISVEDGTIEDVVMIPSQPGQYSGPTPAANVSSLAQPEDEESGEGAEPTSTSAEESADLIPADDPNAVAGTVSEDNTSWTPDGPLDFGQHYTAQVTYAGADGESKSETRDFTVVSPDYIATPTLMSSGGGSISSDREYGVGLVMSVRFDQAPTDRKAAEEHMKVETDNPNVEGSWYWITPNQADWRPREFYPSGTNVSVDIDVAGADLGEGMYGGGERQTANFTIGAKREAIVDDSDKILRMYENGELVGELPTSMGKGGYETHNGVSMHFWTPEGTMTVLDKSPSVVMDSETYGFPIENGGYKTTVEYGVRLSNDGIYTHALGNIWAQGVQNTSHGCLNLSPANAKTYYDWAVAGDVLQVNNTGGPELQPWANGDWNIPWEEWQTGQADF